MVRVQSGPPPPESPSGRSQASPAGSPGVIPTTVLSLSTEAAARQGSVEVDEDEVRVRLKEENRMLKETLMENNRDLQMQLKVFGLEIMF